VATVSWTRRSLNQLNEIRRYLAEDSPESAVSVVRRIEAMADRLGEFPRMGRVVQLPGRRDVRQIIVGNYRLNYHLGSADEVLILSVRHGAQRTNPEEFEGGT
jgi:plasmid stabilization system protein ParE